MRALAVASAIIALFGLAAPSFAGESAARMKHAQALFAEGVEAGKREDWARALDLFRRSQGIVDRPSTSFNIASALMHLDRLEEAVEAFEHLLVIADPEKDGDLCNQAVQRMEDAKRMLAERMPPKAEPNVAAPEPKVDETPTTDAKPVPQAQLEPPDPAPEEPAKAAIVPEPDPKADVKAKTEPERSSGGVLASPIFWIVAGVVIVGAAVATSVLLSSPGEKTP